MSQRLVYTFSMQPDECWLKERKVSTVNTHRVATGKSGLRYVEFSLGLPRSAFLLSTSFFSFCMVLVILAVWFSVFGVVLLYLSLKAAGFRISIQINNLSRAYKRLIAKMEQKDTMQVDDRRDTLLLEVGVSAIQGRRPYMEDRHTVVVDLLLEAERLVSLGEKEEIIVQRKVRNLRERYSLFAVFDGHGGQLASTFASTFFYQHLLNSDHLETSPLKALEEACDVTDRLYADKHKIASSQDGSTACMVLVVGRKIFTANIGDSRAVLGRKGQPVPLSFDHKPDKKEERQRIEDSGGVVKKGSFFNIPMGPFRVYQGDGLRGGLAVSRAFGDTFYKDPSKPKEQWLVSVIPEIIEETINPEEDDFIIVASDGFWDVFTNESAVSKARQMLRDQKMSPADASKALTELAFLRESLDNITVIVVDIKSVAESQGGEKEGVKQPTFVEAPRDDEDSMDGIEMIGSVGKEEEEQQHEQHQQQKETTHENKDSGAATKEEEEKEKNNEEEDEEEKVGEEAEKQQTTEGTAMVVEPQHPQQQHDEGEKELNEPPQGDTVG